MEAFGLTRADAKRQYRLMQRSKVYQSDLYLVHVLEPQEPGGVTHLSIRRQDRCSGTDWREFQDIKNQLCGPEREAVEIYPAESRLVDGANQYHLWVLPEDKQIPFGFNDGRQVDMMPSVPNGSQRGDDGIERWPATVGGDGIQIRLARTRSQHFRGLAGVRLKPDEGMLFIYRTKVDKSFWMKDCVIGLDIAWLSEDLRILRIDSLDAPPPDAADEDIMNAVAPEPIRYVLEMRKGWFASHGLKSGARVSVPEAVRRMKGA